MFYTVNADDTFFEFEVFSKLEQFFFFLNGIHLRVNLWRLQIFLNLAFPVTRNLFVFQLNNSPVVTASQHYQAASLYQQQQQPRMRFNAQQGIRQATAQFTPQQQLQLQQQRSKLIQQQQMKQRLLQQQQQQQLLIPSNATATDQINTGIHNIDSLLNNTVAPNVSLQVNWLPLNLN